MSGNITIAISKGRIFKDALPLLAALDIYPVEAPETTRKLILETNRSDVKIIIVRTTDVPPTWNMVQQILVLRERMSCWNTMVMVWGAVDYMSRLI